MMWTKSVVTLFIVPFRNLIGGTEKTLQCPQDVRYCSRDSNRAPPCIQINAAARVSLLHLNIRRHAFDNYRFKAITRNNTEQWSQYKTGALMLTSWGGYNNRQYKANNEGKETRDSIWFYRLYTTLWLTVLLNVETHAIRCLCTVNCKCWKNFLIRVCQSLCKQWSSARNVHHRNNVHSYNWTPTFRNDLLPQSVVKTSLHFTSLHFTSLVETLLPVGVECVQIAFFLFVSQCVQPVFHLSVFHGIFTEFVSI